MDTESGLSPSSSESEGHIGFFCIFTSPAFESAYRHRHFREDLWLICFLVSAAMLRVALLILADYLHFGVGTAFWPLLAVRFFFLLVSAWVLSVLCRTNCPTAADRLFVGWGFLLAAVTVYSISTRPPGNTGLLLMSFVVVLVAYCATPLSLSNQIVFTLAYSVGILCVSWRVDGSILAMVGLVYAMTNLFGAVVSWRLNRRRREVFLASLREAELRAGLEQAVAEIRTLRGLLSICAWCKRVRDEAEAWQSVESYVQRHTEAAFTHAICPDCMESQLRAVARSRSR